MTTSLEHPLRCLRKAAGLTQAQLANKVPGPMSDQYIGRVEKGLVGELTDLRELFSVLYQTITERCVNEGRPNFSRCVRQIVADYTNYAEEISYPSRLMVDSMARITYMDTEAVYTNLINDWYRLKRYFVRCSINDDDRTEMAREYRTFKEFRIAFVHAAGNYRDDSLYAFCRLLGLHVFVIQRFEAKHGPAPLEAGIAANWPHDLKAALSEVQVGWMDIKFTGEGNG